ncbi:tyrosine-type recombinase/integrase [Microbacterium arborescens]|uniref:tyrosine-type recombinase/integrase n=1 Tax=Microbacterium arborescens TaxID=33883 RepID=UPI00259FEA92|nr:phage integrase N-terminal SAM-like domain-containing protein [Microbacterium arborescens]WJM15523.1 phage integrase N-terminal SAM-like domain-containing protein [Microbacterium arborescens]
MNEKDWDALVRAFLHHRAYTPSTRETYRLGLQTFREWSLESELEPLEATASDILAFREALNRRALAAATRNTRLKNVRSFYGYLHRIGRMDRDPTAELSLVEPARAIRTVPTLEELADLWAVAEGRERVVIGLLAFCSLRRDELRAARAEDLHDRGGVTALSVPQRRAQSDIGYVAVPEQVASEIQKHLDGRRSGRILAPARQNDMVATTFVHQIVRDVARRAGMQGRITSLSLSYVLRSAAMENRFSYLSVVRTLPPGSPDTTAELLRTIDLPPHEHASIRLGKMIAARGSELDEFILRSETLLADRAQHPSSAVMLIAATLERSLRFAAARHGISITKRDASLSTYATQLRARGVLSISQLRTVERILDIRNDAAHGWFERVLRKDALWTHHESVALIRHLDEGPLGT